MTKNEFNEFISDSNLKNLPLDIIEAICGNKIALVKVSETMVQFPFLLRETLFWNKVKKFVDGVYEDSQVKQKLSVRLADNLDNSDYGKRLFRILDDIDTEAKVEYVINLTRALAQGEIDNQLYFRLCNILRKTIDEDLCFIKNNIGYSAFEESIATKEMENNGLMYETKEGYSFTKLAFILNKCGLSYNDENIEIYKPDRLPKPISYLSADENIIIDGGTF